MRERARAATVDCGREHGRQPVLRNLEPVAKRLVALEQRPVAGQPLVELPQHSLELLLRVRRRDGVVERRRFGVEREALAAQHRETGAQRTHLRRQILVPELHQLVGGCRQRLALDRREQLGRVGVELGELAACRYGGRAPLRRAVVGVDIVGIVHADGEHELHVACGELIHGGARTVRGGTKEPLRPATPRRDAFGASSQPAVNWPLRAPSCS